MPPRKKYDPDVWAPPSPSTAQKAEKKSNDAEGKASADGASLSAFQRHFANRTEVLGMSGAGAHLGTAAAPVSREKQNTPSSNINAPKTGSEDRRKQKAASGSTKRTNSKTPAFRIVAPGEATQSGKPRNATTLETKSAAHALPVLSAEAMKRAVEAAQTREALPPIKPAPTRRTLDFATQRNSTSPSQVVEVEMNASDSDGEVQPSHQNTIRKNGTCEDGSGLSPTSPMARLSRRSSCSSSLHVTPQGQPVKCLLAPSALAAAGVPRGSFISSSGVGAKRTALSHSNNTTNNHVNSGTNALYAVTPPESRSSLRPPSAASTSMSHSALTSLPEQMSLPSTPSISGAPAARTGRAAASGQLQREEEIGVPLKSLHASTAAVKRASRVPPSELSAQPPSSAPSSSLGSRPPPLPRRPSPASAEHRPGPPRSTPPPPSASSSQQTSVDTANTSTSPKPAYKPYTLDSYKALMADVSNRKSGGLGPSDTDAQRAAREKRERARAYGRRAERLARQSLNGDVDNANNEGGEEESNEGKGTITASRQAGGEGTKAKRQQRCEKDKLQSRTSEASSSSSSSSTVTSTSSSSYSSSTSTANSRPSSRSPSGAAANHEDAHSRKVARAPPPPMNSKPQRTSSAQPVPSPKSNNANGPAFAVAAASRKEAKQARARRQRALAYAEKIAQERQEQIRAAAEKENASDASASKRSGNGDDGEVVAGVCVMAGATAGSEETRARQQRLVDLEASHAQKKAAVEAIRRQLRCVGGSKSSGD